MQEINKSHVIVVAGPTAVGKTALGIELALRFGGEIVSADSMQIYRRMDIGTAKATPAEQAMVPHHMIDLVDPEEDYSVARYVEDAAAVCDRLLASGKIPVIVGGTGLYIDSLLSGRDFGARDEDLSLRAELSEKYDRIGGEKMLEELASFDPKRASVLYPADKKRITRAFEVYLLSGETITEHDEKTKALPPRYEATFIIPGFSDRSLLYSRIDRRVDDMIRSGLFEEVRALIGSGVPAGCTAMQAIGYKEIISCLNGRMTAEESAELIRQSSRRYAKRQITWFGRRENALRLNHDECRDENEFKEIAFRYAEGKI